MCALMINADDWGASDSTTSAIARCFDAGALSAASAMVYMTDSERAAERAIARGLPIGLHLNLTQPFDARDVPDQVRARQVHATRRFAHLRVRRWIYDPRGRAKLAQAIVDQLEEFERLYGERPRRIDGHLHVHLCPDVLRSPALPRDVWLRSARTVAVDRATPGLATLRRARERWLRARFATSDYFFSIEDIDPALGGEGLTRALDLAEHADVEVMTHPSRPGELARLLSDDWRATLDGRPLVAFQR